MNTKDETSQDTITPQPTETSNAEKTLVKETSVSEEPNSTDIILPTHILSADSGISILPFQRHIWSEEVEISVKKSPGIATLIISEKNTGHVSLYEAHWKSGKNSLRQYYNRLAFLSFLFLKTILDIFLSL